jgi:hypothetical protein
MNRMPEEVLLGLREKGTKKKYTAPKLPRDEASTKVYRTTSETIIVPTENLMSCLIQAGVYIKLDGRRQLSTKDSTMLPGFLDIEEPWLVLNDHDGNENPDWEVDIRKGTNPNGKEAVCIVRPRFDAWEISFSMLVATDELAEEVFRRLIDIAGSRIGLCDFRPAKKGTFGKFGITRWEVSELSLPEAA